MVREAIKLNLFIPECSSTLHNNVCTKHKQLKKVLIEFLPSSCFGFLFLAPALLSATTLRPFSYVDANEFSRFDIFHNLRSCELRCNYLWWRIFISTPPRPFKPFLCPFWMCVWRKIGKNSQTMHAIFARSPDISETDNFQPIVLLHVHPCARNATFITSNSGACLKS